MRASLSVSAVELDIKQIEQLQQLGFGDVALWCAKFHPAPI
jgi:hypothetical protein